MPDHFIGYAIDVVTLSLITWIFIRIRPRADDGDSFDEGPGDSFDDSTGYLFYDGDLCDETE